MFQGIICRNRPRLTNSGELMPGTLGMVMAELVVVVGTSHGAGGELDAQTRGE